MTTTYTPDAHGTARALVANSLFETAIRARLSEWISGKSLADIDNQIRYIITNMPLTDDGVRLTLRLLIQVQQSLKNLAV